MASTSTKPAKPTFLGLLNAIAVAETEAEEYLLAWADVTKDPKLEQTLRFVAMREGEHGKAFSKRMMELGFDVRWPERKGNDDKLRCASSKNKSDAKKFKELRVGLKPGPTDVFDDMFLDKTIDPITGALLGRYIAEERDTARILRKARKRVV
jgi:hypothetical protein